MLKFLFNLIDVRLNHTVEQRQIDDSKWKVFLEIGARPFFLSIEILVKRFHQQM